MQILSEDILKEIEEKYNMEVCQHIEDEMLESMIEEELGSLGDFEIGGFRKNYPKSKDAAKVVKSKGNKRDKAKLREEKELGLF